jgi:predicted ATPase/DNA-binding SARP family transcriptional activator
MKNLHLSLLGPFAATVGGGALPAFRTRKGASLLAMLALRSGSPVLRTSIVDALWPDSDAENGLYNLRRTLSDLRRCLGDAASRIESIGHSSVCLKPETNDFVDVLEFRRLVKAGTKDAMTSAAKLYRGPLMEGFDEAWLLLDRISVDQEFLSALEVITSHAMNAGNYPEVILYSMRLTELDPLRESAYRTLMLAHAIMGNQTAAIAVYHDLRLLLLRELNLAPSMETEELYRHILEGDLKVEAQEAASESPETSANELPVPITPLIGRTDQLESLIAAISENRLVTLKGMGGIGKTRLALEAGLRLKAKMRDGVRFLDLVAVTEPSQAAEYAHSVLCHLNQNAEPSSLYEALKNSEMLLIVDNCEHVIDAAASLIHNLLTHCPHLRIVATSREALGIPGEKIWIVPPLAVPPMNTALELDDDIARIAAYDAVRFFVDRAARTEHGFSLTPRTAPHVVTICSALEGIPLALELAASSLDAVTAEQLAQSIENRLQLPESLRTTRHSRHRSLYGLVNWSYNLLTAEERQLMLQLSMFQDGFTLEDAAAICGEELGAGAAAIAAALVKKSLVEVHDGPDGTRRCRMLESVREFAHQQLAESGSLLDAKRRFSHYFIRLAEEQDRLFHKEHARCTARLSAEHSNFREAFNWMAATEGEAESSLRLVVALRNYFIATSRFSEALDWLERALSAAPDADIKYVNRASNGAGCMCFCLGYLEKAEKYYYDTIGMSELEGDYSGKGYALHNLALIAMQRGDTNKTQELMNQSIPILRDCGAIKGLSDILYNMAIAAVQRGEYSYASQLLHEGMEMPDGGSSEANRGRMLTAKALIEERTGRIDEAEATLRSALDLFDRAGDRHRCVSAMHPLAVVYMKQGRIDQAIALMDEAMSILSEVQDQHLMAELLLTRAAADRLSGDIHRARQRLFRAADMARRNSEYLLCLKIGLELTQHLSATQLQQTGKSVANQIQYAIERGAVRLDQDDSALLAQLHAAAGGSDGPAEAMEIGQLLDLIVRLVQMS